MSDEARHEIARNLFGAKYPVSGEIASRPHRLLLPYRFIQPTNFIVELFIIVTTSIWTGIAYHRLFLGEVGSIPTFFGVGLLVFVNFSAISAARGNYHVRNLVNSRRQVRDATLTWTLVCSILLGVAFSLKITESFSRGASLTFFLVGWAAVVAWRVLAAKFLARALSNGAFAERKIVVIAEEGQLALSRVPFELQRCGYKAVKTFEVKRYDTNNAGVPASLRGTIEAVTQTCRKERIDGLFLLIRWEHRRWIEDILSALRVLPVPVHLVPDENVARFLSSSLVNVGTVWAAELKRAPLSAVEQALKRSVDLVGAGFGLMLLLPLLMITALLIRLDSKGPVLFTQARNGFNGRSFRILKFRTMNVIEDGPIVRQATQDDPRVTRLGRLLRQSSIDELPQLYNVLRGDMSLVGPRPHATAHDNEYEKLVSNYAFRHHVKPGITGWAQVSGFRGETQTVNLMAQRVELDLWYINNWTIWLDLRILLKTLTTVPRQRIY